MLQIESIWLFPRVCVLARIIFTQVLLTPIVHNVIFHACYVMLAVQMVAFHALRVLLERIIQLIRLVCVKMAITVIPISQHANFVITRVILAEVPA